MSIAAMICGLIGGILGIFIGMAGYGYGSFVGFMEPTSASAARNYQLISLAVPIAGIVGAAIVRANALIAGLLMAASAAGMFHQFGFNMFTGVPLALTAVGALLAFAAIFETRAPART